MNRERLFLASCIALVATSMSFAIRGDILVDFEREFVVPFVTHEADVELDSPAEGQEFVKTYLGVISTVAFFSFGLSILFGGPLVDLLGMGRLMRLAAVCHIGGTVLTIFAPGYWTVVFATFVIGAGNGIVEAVCNPLIATIYPEEKTRKLTLFHAWFPGGIVIGGLLAFAFSRIGLGWQIKMSLLLIPSFIYLWMVFTEKFPPTERVASGVSFSEMLLEAFRKPLFIVVFIVMWMTAATELVPGGWISNIYNDVMGREEGILTLVWGSILMYILRQFFSKPAHSISPILLILVTTPIAALGLFLFNYAQSPAMFFFAATLLYLGVCFWWPSMLGIAAERCPRSGAFGLALLGGAGSLSTWLAGPIMGWLNDMYGPARCLQIWAILPVMVFVVFLVLHLRDLKAGGYKAQQAAAMQELRGGNATNSGG